jgi:D-arabinose 1-dehydrogenase-like Zn-dependent alcohol dehydrogenase
MRKHVQIIGSRSASIDHYQRALEFIERNAARFDWEDMITSTHPFERINDALERMGRFEDVKAALTFR